VDPPVEVPDDLADRVLGGQVLDRRGEPFGFLAQPQRDRQQFVGGHALAAQVVLQPGLGPAAPAGNRLARAGQIVEGTPAGRLGDLLIDPRADAHFPRFSLSHAGFHASGARVSAGRRIWRPVRP